MKELIMDLVDDYTQEAKDFGHLSDSIPRKALADALDRIEAENAALREGLDGWHSRYLDCEVERDVEKEHVRQCVANIAKLVAENAALRATCGRARGCIAGLLKRTPVRDVAETLAEIDDAIGEKK